MAAVGRSKSSPRSADGTLVEHATQQIRHDLIAGALLPGKKLAIQDLVARYKIGATPIREALSRMSLSGMVIPLGNRGFSARELSYDDLLDITTLRQLVEAEAVRRSIKEGTVEWEAGIVAALYQLKHQSRAGRVSGEIADDTGFDQAHQLFHRALIAACGSTRMLDLHQSLYDQAHRYRRMMMPSARVAHDFIEEHESLTDSVLSRDPERAAAALSHHLHLTLAFVYPRRE